jgi:hypothetical protein
MLAVAGCSNEAELLKEEVRNKEIRIQELHRELEQLRAIMAEYRKIDMLYISPTAKRRFVEKETPMLLFPLETAPVINTIQENSVVDINDMVGIEEQVWLYVTKFDFSVHNVKGWVKLEDTLPYTSEKTPLVRCHVEIPAGTPVYQTYDFDQVASMTPVPWDWDYDHPGIIVQERDGYVKIALLGGTYVILEKKYLIYPEVLEDKTESLLKNRQ